MVTFKLVKKTDNEAVYHYFPEGHKDYGIVAINLADLSAKVICIAENDFKRVVTTEELKESLMSVNETNKELGLPPIGEDEWSTEEFESIYYADPAITKIRELCKNGEVPKEGMAMWY